MVMKISLTVSLTPGLVVSGIIIIIILIIIIIVIIIITIPPTDLIDGIALTPLHQDPGKVPVEPFLADRRGGLLAIPQQPEGLHSKQGHGGGGGDDDDDDDDRQSSHRASPG
jgi:hypothetical protein